MHEKFEYATLEWLWDQSNLRCNFPNGDEQQFQGSYAEVVDVLSDLGQNGWEVCGCVAAANWLFWTLKRKVN